jgi:hypothetical protein
MYKKIQIILVFMIGYVILRYTIHKTIQIDGFRDQRINNLPRFTNTGVGISSTVYDINLSSKYTDPYCYNNPNLCNKPL